MSYILNKPYTGAKLAKEIFNISSNTFYAHKEEYLDYLSNFFNWTITTKGSYILLNEIKPYESLKEKNSKEKRMQYYKERTDKIIAAEPYNSGSNVARNIQVNNKYNVQEDTVARYVRKVLRQCYTTIDDRWSRPSDDNLHYIPLTEEELTYLKELFKTKGNNELNYKYCAEYQAGNISKQEFLELLGDNVLNDYNTIMNLFKERYGYRPIKTKKYEPHNWEDTPQIKEN